MIPLTLAEVADAAAGKLAGPGDLVVTGPATADSRDVSPGGLFVAVSGERADGHDYAAQAVTAGAAACLVSRPVDVPHVLVDDVVAALARLTRRIVDELTADGLTVVALTGSSGKTSTKDLLAQLLPLLGPTVAPTGSFNNEIGVPLTALRADRDTRYLVVEMGARGPGHIAALCAITPPRIGMVLNVGTAHAGEFGSRAATAQAKAELVDALPPAADGGVAVLNADDDLVAAMAQRTAARVVWTGRADRAQVRAADVRLDRHGHPSFRLHVETAQPVDVRLPLVGAHHVANALAAAAVALECGLTAAEVAAALARVRPLSQWRMEVRTRADGLTVVNDAYNANPESVRAALEALVALAGGRRTWAVLGEMLELGAASAPEHERVGRLCRSLGVDRVVVVGHGARAVHEGALAGGAVDGEGTVLVPDVAAAVQVLRCGVDPGDVVLVKASRGIGLDRVAAALLDGPEGRPAPGAT